MWACIFQKEKKERKKKKRSRFCIEEMERGRKYLNMNKEMKIIIDKWGKRASLRNMLRSLASIPLTSLQDSVILTVKDTIRNVGSVSLFV